MYFPFIAAVFAQIFTVRVQNFILKLSSRLLKQTFSLLYVLVAEIAFEFEFLQVEHTSYEGINIEDVDDDEQNQKDGKNIIEGLSEHRNYISFPHHSRKRCLLTIDYL
jgi:hypothetical protein